MIDATGHGRDLLELDCFDSCLDVLFLEGVLDFCFMSVANGVVVGAAAVPDVRCAHSPLPAGSTTQRAPSERQSQMLSGLLRRRTTSASPSHHTHRWQIAPHHSRRSHVYVAGAYCLLSAPVMSVLWRCA